jgi:hypothetical protein
VPAPASSPSLRRRPNYILDAYGCATVEEMDATVAELQSAFDTERALLG